MMVHSCKHSWSNSTEDLYHSQTPVKAGEGVGVRGEGAEEGSKDGRAVPSRQPPCHHCVGYIRAGVSETVEQKFCSSQRLMSGSGPLKILHEVAFWSKGASRVKRQIFYYVAFWSKGLPKVKRQIFYDIAFWSKGLLKVNRQIRCPSDKGQTHLV